MFYDSPRYSSGYAALSNTLSFMQGTHVLKSYTQRFTSTYDLMVSFIHATSENKNTIVKQKKDADHAKISQQYFLLK